MYHTNINTMIKGSKVNLMGNEIIMQNIQFDVIFFVTLNIHREEARPNYNLITRES